MVRAWDEELQRLLHAHRVPRSYTLARALVPVVVVLLWQHDGAERVDTLATAWTARLVLVRVDDPRHRIRAAWLAGRDVHRFAPRSIALESRV